MVRVLRSWLWLLAFLAGGAAAFAASSAENKAFGLATNAFRVGFWEQAERDLNAFTQKFPESEHNPAAILFQARARFQLKQFAGTVDLLSAHQGRAGALADQYVYWIGRAHFESGSSPAAADAFARLNREFPRSPLRLEAAVREATAHAQLEQWPRVVELLGDTNGVFRQAARERTGDELVVSGFLLLAEAQRLQKNFAAMNEALDAAGGRSLPPDLAWRREFIRCRALGDQGMWEEARKKTAELPAPAGVADRAEQVAFAADACEALQLLDAAIAEHRKNLAPDVPVARQRRALLKIAELSLVLHRTGEAVQTLEGFLARFPGGDVAELATVTLGELQLSRAVSEGGTNRAAVDTNFLSRALGQFDSLLNRFPESPLAGRALLGKGWCLWLDEKWDAAAAQFRLATTRLVAADDQAVARFKWADAQYQLKDLDGALANYRVLTEQYASAPGARTDLVERALYQTIRVALDKGDTGAATNALRRVVEWYPNSFAGPSALLLAGQGLARQSDPAGAQGLFAEFAERYPTNALLPEVRLAIARTFEAQGKWDDAIARHDEWINDFTNHPARVEAEYWRAWDHYAAGRETNALRLFTNFVARFPTNELAARAWWWMGDYYFRLPDLLKAEDSYQHVPKVWPESELAYPARMMAGRVAMARLAYKDAISYFTNLVSDLACPADLKAKAAIVAGDAWRLRTDLGETNREANLREAIGWYETATNTLASQALGLIGDCYLQLAVNDEQQYNLASEFYQRVVQSPSASLIARSQARVRLAFVAEKQAQLKTDDPDAEAAFLKQALAGYLEVFFDPQLRAEASPDCLFWMRRAGLDVGRVAETLQQWQQAINVYCELKDLLPFYRAAAENRIQRVLEKCPECTGCNAARPMAVESPK